MGHWRRDHLDVPAMTVAALIALMVALLIVLGLLIWIGPDL